MSDFFGKKAKKFGKIGIAKAETIRVTVEGPYEQDRLKFLSMTTSLGVTFTGTSVLGNVTNDRISALESFTGTGGSIDNRISINETDIASLQTDVNTNTTNISTNAFDIALNTADISTNTSDISTLQLHLATAQADITTNATDIATLTATLNTLITTVNDIDTRLSALEARLTSYEEHTHNYTDVDDLGNTNTGTTGGPN